MKKIIISLVILLLLGVLYYAISPLFDNTEVNEKAPEEIAVQESISSGFEDLSPEDQKSMRKQMEEMNNQPTTNMDETTPDTTGTSKEKAQPVRPVMKTFGHPAEGTVRIINTANGPVARYENFSTINGPRLHVYLSKDLDGVDFIDLGPIKGTQGNINYTLPPDVDLSEYKYLMHWCVPFGVLFNYAEVG